MTELDYLLNWVGRILPPYAAIYLDGTFADHDPDAADALIRATPTECRHAILNFAWRTKAPLVVFRRMLERCWGQNPGCVFCAVKDADEARQMFDYGEWPVPFEGKVTVYRGTRQRDLQKAADGFSWTMRFDVACGWAVKWTDLQDGPSKRTAVFDPEGVILKAEVDASEIVFFSDALSEAEIILRSAPKTFEVLKASRSWVAMAQKIEDAYLERVRTEIAPQLASLLQFIPERRVA